jgi:4-aminobutyrate aminotransferase-like enzyme
VRLGKFVVVAPWAKYLLTDDNGSGCHPHLQSYYHPRSSCHACSSLRQPTTNTSTAHDYFLARQARFESSVRSYPRKLPLAIAQAQGCWITDVDGRRFLDCLAGAGTLALGHNHPLVIQAIRDTLDSGLPLHTLDLATPL